MEDLTGLSYYGARWYNPAVGRFYSVDPVQFKETNPLTFNRYAYGNNNPYRYKDPNGMWVEDIAVAGISIGLGYFSLVNNLTEGKWGAAIVDALGIGHDLIATAIPVYPAAAGVAIAAARGSAKAVSVGAESTTLYRAVGEAEASQLRTTGKFEVGPGSLGGKWFAESRDHARQWGDAMNGKGNSTIFEARVPRRQADDFMRAERLDGIGPARFGEIDQLLGTEIRELGR